MARPVPLLPEDAAFEKVRNFLKERFGSNTVAAMFSAKERADLEITLSEKLLSGMADPNFDADKYLKEIVAPHLEEVGEAALNLQNVDEQMFKIKAWELQPDKTNVEQIAKELTGEIGFQGDARMGYFHDRTDIPSMPSSIFGGTQKTKEKIKSLARPHTFMTQPSSTYRNMVSDLRSECVADLAIAKEKMIRQLTGKDDLTKKEIRTIRRSANQSPFPKLSNFGEAAAFGILEASQWAGRGIWSHTKAQETAEYEKFMHELNNWIARTRLLLDKSSPVGASYLKVLDSFYSQMAKTGDGVFSEKEFNELQGLVKNALQQADAEHAKKLENFNTATNEANKELLGLLKDKTKDEDDMWKYRIAQIVLILSPLGMFNYMIPVANMLGPILSANLTFGEGLGQVAANVPLFGKVVEAIHLDVAIAAVVDNFPILSQVTGAINSVTDTAAAQDLFGAFSPMVSGSPMIPLAIAAFITLRNGEKDVDIHDKYDKKIKEAYQKMQRRFTDLEKSVTGDAQIAQVTGLAKAEIEANVNRSFLNHLVQFIVTAKEEELKIFNSVNLGGKTIMQLKSEGKDGKEIIELLLNDQVCNKDMRSKLIGSLFVYEKICEDGMDNADVAENITKFEGLPTRAMDDLIQKEGKRNRDEIIINFAQKNLKLQTIYAEALREKPELIKDPQIRGEIAADYEAQILQARVNQRVREGGIYVKSGTKAPSSAPRPTDAELVSGQGKWAGLKL